MIGQRVNVDPSLRVLAGGSGVGEYQLAQLLFINLGALGAAFQLFDNIFIGRKVTWHQCAQSRSSLGYSRGAAASLQDRFSSGGNSSHVTYGQCQITVHKGNREEASYPCVFGHDYDYPRELSFRTEFDLVCDQSLLADLLQTLVILGQGFGAVLASFLSDRHGRKRVLVYSQLGLFGVGVAIALAPNYASLALLKFLAGCFQQGVVTGKATMSIELLPSEHRSLMMPAMAVMWVTGMSSLAVLARLLRHRPWRWLQAALSCLSLPIALLQLRYVDESIRWLVVNGRREAAVRVLKHAARVNRKDFNTVIDALYGSSPETNYDSDFPTNQRTTTITTTTKDSDQEPGISHKSMSGYGIPLRDTYSDQSETGTPLLGKKMVLQKKLTIFDLFDHKRLRFYTLVIWMSWFSCAFCNFTLYLMSTSLHGDRFLNFFLVGLTELPACLLFYCTVDRAGRKPTLQLFFLLCAVGILSSGFFRIFEDSGMSGLMSLLTAMLGTMGATGVFGAMFFYTPEIYPTNIRQQALGFASFAGRLGGMLAPFMVPLSEVIVWLPGAITGTLCFIVILLFRFLPETQGRELPQTLQDIDSWVV